MITERGDIEQGRIVGNYSCCSNLKSCFCDCCCTIPSLEDFKVIIACVGLFIGLCFITFFAGLTNMVTSFAVCDGRESTEYLFVIISQTFTFVSWALLVLYKLRTKLDKNDVQKLATHKMWLSYVLEKYYIHFVIVAPLGIQNVCNLIAIILHLTTPSVTCGDAMNLVLGGLVGSAIYIVLMAMRQCFTKIEIPKQ